MVKPLLLVALVANLFYSVSTGQAYYYNEGETNGSSSASASSKSVSKSSPSRSCGSPQPSRCELNEVWSDCPAAVCVPKTCKDVGFPVPCPDLNPDGECPVPPGCICKKDYVRNSIGLCIPMKHCPSCGGDCNAESGPGTNCNRLCSNYNKKPGPCILGFFDNACECKRGFVFDEIKRKCVFPEDCTYMKCRRNEVYDPCPASCPLRLCGFNDAAVLCPQPLPPGHPNCRPPTCRCKDGYYRDHLGKCVRSFQCPVCIGINEIYDPCMATCPAQRCDVDPAAVQCLRGPSPGDRDCKPGCRCIDDHVRNKTGVCIPRKQCPICTRDNEIFDSCIAPCPPHSCDVDERLIRCAAPPQPGDKDCVSGCRCADGFFRTSYGACVTWDECPKCKGPNEFYECGGACDNECATLHKQNRTNCPIVNIRCNNKCYCKDGYARDENNVCIPVEKCKAKCQGPNEFYECGGACDNECATLHKQNRTNCPIVNIRCNDKCYCKNGYARDENNVCIPVKKCKVPKCGKHEIYSNCTQRDCRPQNCSQLGYEVSCPKIDSKQCKKGCLCEQDYVRDSNGVCVPVHKCPSCGGDPHAKSGCGNNCGRLCSNYDKGPVACTLECKINGCECEKHHVFDQNTEKCVLPKDCTPVCKINEVYSTCINGGCTAKNCSQIGQSIPCVKMDPKYCITGCLCKKDYLRDDNGNCVPTKQCKPKCDKPNEEYVACDYNCPPDTCESLDRAYVCPIREGDTCEPRCKCKQGYFRNKNGECITEKECRRQQCNKNEIYDKCPACLPRKCRELGYPLPCANSTSTVCQKPGCVCIDDYVWNDDGVCIPKKTCPSCGGDSNAVSGCGNCVKKCEDLLCEEPQACIQVCEDNACDCKDGHYYDKYQKKCVLASDCTGICGKNEVFENCDNPSCRPKKCSEVGYNLNCTEPIPCKKGCVCKYDYVRNSKGICIPIKNCPSCKGDKHAVSGCGVNCLKKCYDLQYPKKPRPCPKICKVNDCDCIAEYYFDEVTETCVKPKDCTPICGPNEVIDRCINGGCEKKNCSQLSDPKICIDPVECISGCSCKKGYLRSDTGICVPIEKCPKPKCPKHEIFELCPEAVFRPLYCDELGYPLERQSINGTCQCSPACICAEGYVKNKHGKCIPKRNCPSCGGDCNAWSGCGRNCNRTCSDLNCEPKKCTKKCIENSCDCKDGFYYDANTGKCVTADCCTPTCGNNEVYNPCFNGGCGHRNCSQRGGSVLCIDPITCFGGCSCKKGYLRLDSTGECIPEEKCPMKCPRNNEYLSCGPGCDNVCRDLDKQSKDNCPIKNKKCVSKCYCKDGYARDDDDNCVPISDCPGPVNITTALDKFERGNVALTFNFLKQMVEDKPGENFMFSALSVIIAFAQLTLNAFGTTLKQLLHLQNLTKEEIRAVYPVFLKNIKEQQEVIFSVANKIYGNNVNPFTEDFLNEGEKIFGSSAENIDFSKREEAAATINKWASGNTNGLIKDLVKSSMFNSDTRMAVFNALYFLGKWVRQFKEENTKPADFYLDDDNKISLPTMYQQNTFPYAESDYLGCQILKLPYKGNFSLVLYLSWEKTGLKNLVSKLAEPNAFADSLGLLKNQKVQASIPKMDFKTDFSALKNYLMKYNVTAVFSPSEDFKGIFVNEEPLLVTDILQKSYFKVDEKGTEAAAVTGIVVGTTAVLNPPPVYKFELNHPAPFVLVMDKNPVFCGVFSGAQ